jgi:hypothetical protein
VQIPALDDAISDFILDDRLGVVNLPELDFKKILLEISRSQVVIGNDLRNVGNVLQPWEVVHKVVEFTQQTRKARKAIAHLEQ